MPRSKIIKAVLLGLLSAVFLSSGLTINSLNAFHGGSWAWTASLRFLLLLPVLLVIVMIKVKLVALITVMKKIPGTFLLWGNLGFGGYYALLSFAMRDVPGWLVTAAFMTTVLAGIIIAPFIYTDHRAVISKKAFLLSFFLVVSLLIMQLERLVKLHDATMGISILLALLAAFLWPLGNRKLILKLEEVKETLDPMQRVLGMTIGSLPILIILAAYAYLTSGLPTAMQLETSFIAVLFSGIFGSILFYKAMHMVAKHHMAMLAVEATQVTGVLFTLLGEMIFKGTAWPGFYANLGFCIMAAGLLGYALLSLKRINASY